MCSILRSRTQPFPVGKPSNPRPLRKESSSTEIGEIPSGTTQTRPLRRQRELMAGEGPARLLSQNHSTMELYSQAPVQVRLRTRGMSLDSGRRSTTRLTATVIPSWPLWHTSWRFVYWCGAHIMASLTSRSVAPLLNLAAPRQIQRKRCALARPVAAVHCRLLHDAGGCAASLALGRGCR